MEHIGNYKKEETIMTIVIGIMLFFIATCFLDEYLAKKGGEKDEK